MKGKSSTSIKKGTNKNVHIVPPSKRQQQVTNSKEVSSQSHNTVLWDESLVEWEK